MTRARLSSDNRLPSELGLDCLDNRLPTTANHLCEAISGGSVSIVYAIVPRPPQILCQWSNLDCLDYRLSLPLQML